MLGACCLPTHFQTGNCALLSGLDGVIRLLDRSTGEMLNHYKGCVLTCDIYTRVSLLIKDNQPNSNLPYSPAHLSPPKTQPRAQILPRRVPF